MIEKSRKFGEELAQHRTSKGVSLDEIAKATKIHKPVLEALEAGRFEELPPEVFTIGFLRAYAEHVGLNPVQLVAQYKQIQEPETEEKTKPSARQRATPSKGLLWGLLVVALACLGAAWLIYAFETGVWPFAAVDNTSGPAEGRHKPKETAAPAPLPAGQTESQPLALPSGQAGQESAPQPASPPPAPVESSPAISGLQVPLGGQSSQPGPPPATLAPQEQSAGDLVLKCTQSCWIELWGDGKRLLYRQVTPGENLVFNGARFRFDIGNASGVQVTWKGRPVALPTAKGRVVKNFVLPPQPERGAEP